MRVIVSAAALVALAMPSTARGASPHMCEQAAKVRASVVNKHGKRAPGRDICKHGMRNGRKPSNGQKARYLRALRRLNNPPVMLTEAGPPPVAPAATQSPRAGGTLRAIAACESGGNPRAVSPDGTYRGLYQFDYQTWQSVGGSGDPAAASPAEQDRRAAILYSQRGASPWPVCGR